MTWLELQRRGALPEGATSAMASALDRRMRGVRITAREADMANRLLGLLDRERAQRASVDWNFRDELLRNQVGARDAALSRVGRPVPASPASPARPGAVETAAAPRPTTTGGGRGTAPGGGAALRRSSYDARTSSNADFRARCQQLGVDTSSWYEDRQQPPPKAPSLGIRVKEQRLAAETAQRQTARTAQLEAGRIDARNAPAEDVRRRMEALGVDYQITSAVREVPKPLPPPDRGPDPLAASLEAQRRAERRARQALKSGRPVDVREMPSDVFQKFLELRGYASPTSWGPAGRAPSRR